MSGTKPAVRWRIVVPPVVLGVGVLLAARFGIGWLVTPARWYEWNFDRNIEQTAPHVLPALQADRALHKLVLERTERAFLNGGWPAASGVFWHQVHADIQAFAADDTTNACTAAWRELYRALQPFPEQCRGVDDDQSGITGFAVVPGAVRAMNAACNAAIEDGGRRRLHMRDADILPYERFSALWYQVNAGWAQTDSQSGRCAARLRQFDNIMAIGAQERAAFMRRDWSSEANDDFVAGRTEVAPEAAPPDDFSCAPAGTVFVLSMFGQDARPITWTSQGQDGFDCKLSSSASGERHLFHEADYERPQHPLPHTLRSLWPLRIGKTAHYSFWPADGDSEEIDYRVVGYDQYWFPWGHAGAWAIDSTVRMNGSAQEYVMTEYWSPALGFKVGQRTVVHRGGWPDGVSPDWQVVAIKRP